uniref:Uncharacterized protein n=1 Tax=Arundo donax TaxID=35708 RepID=A0A0A9HNY1_ARUDO
MDIVVKSNTLTKDTSNCTNSINTQVSKHNVVKPTLHPCL